MLNINYFRAVFAIFIGAAIVVLIMGAEERRLVELEKAQLGPYFAEAATPEKPFGGLAAILLAAAGLGLVVSAFYPAVARRLGALQLPFVRRSEIDILEEEAKKIASGFGKDIVENESRLHEIVATLKARKQAEKEKEIDSRVSPEMEEEVEYPLNVAVCGDFPPFPEHVLDADEIHMFPLENVENPEDESLVDVVLVGDDKIAACSKRIRALGKPVLVASDSPEERMKAYLAFKELALFYTPYERLREPNHLVAEVEMLYRVERATRFREGSRRLITLCSRILGILEDIDKNFSGTLLNVPIILQGPSGAGKELIARAIAQLMGKHIVPVNVKEATEGLWDSYLLGHKKGAFTDAKADRTGLVELAHAGILMLDEVADMTLNLQAALLRILDMKEFRRVGGEKLRRSDFQLISATNKDLDAMVAKGQFRWDMLMRIRGLAYAIPSLAERRSDIPLLLHYLLGKLIGKTGKYVRLSEYFVKSLHLHPLNGNVRELKALLETAFIPALEGETIFNFAIPGGSEKLLTIREKQEAELREETLKALLSTNWKVTEAAKILGYSSEWLRKRMAEHKLAVRG